MMNFHFTTHNMVLLYATENEVNEKIVHEYYKHTFRILLIEIVVVVGRKSVNLRRAEKKIVKYISFGCRMQRVLVLFNVNRNKIYLNACKKFINRQDIQETHHIHDKYK